MAEQFSNTAKTTLANSCSNVATSIVVSSASAFPVTGNFRLRVENELMLVTAVAGATFTVTRGVEGTVAASHPAAADVKQVLTAGSLPIIIKEVAESAAVINLGTNATGVLGSANGGSGANLTLANGAIAPFAGEFLTSDAVETTALFLALQDEALTDIAATVTARGNNGQNFAVDVRVAFERTAGVATNPRPVVIANALSGNPATWTASIDRVANNECRVRVKGAAGINVRWTVTGSIQVTRQTKTI